MTQRYNLLYPTERPFRSGQSVPFGFFDPEHVRAGSIITIIVDEHNEGPFNNPVPVHYKFIVRRTETHYRGHSSGATLVAGDVPTLVLGDVGN